MKKIILIALSTVFCFVSQVQSTEDIEPKPAELVCEETQEKSETTLGGGCRRCKPKAEEPKEEAQPAFACATCGGKDAQEEKSDNTNA